MLVGEGVPIVSGSMLTTADIYHFNVTNLTGEDIFAFDSFRLTVTEGTFFEGSQLSSPTADLEFNAFAPPSGRPVGDSFFVLGDPAFPGTVVDSASELSASAFANLGSPIVVDGATETVAVLTVTEGAVVGFDLNAFAFNSGGNNIGSFFASKIPEPTSLALLAAGLGVCGLRVLRSGAV
ncbi:MAG: PEP-CTERM sorting domain-containing protein [Planctomycetota bacterium]